MIPGEDVRSGPAVTWPRPRLHKHGSLDKTSGSGDDEQPFPKAHAESSLSIFSGKLTPQSHKGPKTSLSAHHPVPFRNIYLLSPCSQGGEGIFSMVILKEIL